MSCMPIPATTEVGPWRRNQASAACRDQWSGWADWHSGRTSYRDDVITIMDVEASHDTVSDYLLAHSAAEDDVLARLAEETRTTFSDFSGMQITADEGALLTMLTRLTGARSA